MPCYPKACSRCCATGGAPVGNRASCSPMAGSSRVRTRGFRSVTRQLYRVVVEAAEAADIAKRVGPHTLRHSFATHLLEDGVDIRVIQALLGHAKLNTTAFYAQVATKTMRAVVSPLDRLALAAPPEPEAPGG